MAILRSQVVADLRGRARKQRIWKQISGCRSKRKAERHVVIDRITDYRLRGPLAASTDSYICPIGTRGEIVGRILIGLGFVPIALTISYQAALAAPVYLNCQASGVLVVSRYLTIDYGTSTVVTSGLNVTTPTPDVEGRTAQPAQITRFRDCVALRDEATRRAELHRKLHAQSAKWWYDLFRSGHTAWGILDLPSWCEAPAQVLVHPTHRQLMSAIGSSAT